MARRLLMNPGRLILTKPGFDARDPGLANNQKLLDSDWNFSGVIIASGTMTDPAPPVDSSQEGQTATNSSAPMIINFPSPGYVPAAIVHYVYDWSIGFIDVGFPGFRRESSRWYGSASRVYEDRVEVHRMPFGSSYHRFAGTVHYKIIGVG
ncbi:hypothetical protein [Shinella sp.]|uniref:hypothetical protein n=1 Tax=Shinella sp. TaxID=1870904 RepID=UPI0028AC4391|nr:hypothetical protein [Shinella sp.]